MAVEDAEQYADLLGWAASKGITDTPPELEWAGDSPTLGFSLRIATFPEAGGRGLTAARELKLGELILRVPEEALMNGKSARQDVELARVLASCPSLSDVQVLCVHLLREIAKGRTSERYPYLVHLPRYYHTASFYSSFEAQALQVKDAVSMAEGAAQSCREQWLEARPVLGKLELGRRFSTFQAWLWASATIASRTLYVPWDEAGTLCPFGDFFNYACPGVSYDSPTSTQDTSVEDGDSYGLEIRDRLRDGGFEHDRAEYCFYARQDYQEGQQVLLCYGTYTNLELLEHYGFLLPFNPNDKIHIDLPSVDELNPGASRGCQEAVSPKDLYIDHEGKPSFSLLSNLRLRAAPASLLKTRRHLALAGQQISPESDKVLFQWLKTKCQTILRSCSTSLQADELLLKIIDAHPAMVQIQKFLAVCKDDTASPSIRSDLLFNASEHLHAVITHEVEGFIASVSHSDASSTSSLQEDLRLERWRLAVEWRLGFKKVVMRCISRCSRL
ncbi:hypothetical protein M758_12G005100 [Ceratodon purpureus]|uniref:SET domain-containing protein n=1 Tax=Ceratodon purpureus TaxID=3225 RepID=A0A8T0G369_CERPU|nr:hypothetical protein KC19_12G004800 [Ceratodon purpureus]KAG0597567.1 hypothetical protein M758_12G005100 [Ceratodon purpureus]